ncbi:MAG TPA: MFS transporter [Dehalococcoidia bacterium]|nr:MFS transporter [Dehalococcoidia bacterium]
MNSDKSREPDRDEIIQRWKERAERDQQQYTDERHQHKEERREPWKYSRRIKVWDWQTLVIAPGFVQRLRSNYFDFLLMTMILGSGISMIVISIIRWSFPFILLAIIGLFFTVVGWLYLIYITSKKIIISKYSGTIVFEFRDPLLIKRQRSIPISKAKKVVINKDWFGGPSWEDSFHWECSLDTGEEDIKLESLNQGQRNEEDIYSLARAIGAFLEKEVVDRSSEPQSAEKPSAIRSWITRRLR